MQQVGWELAGSWGEGTPAWGSSCLLRPGTPLPTCSPSTAVQLPCYTAIGTGLVTFPILSLLLWKLFLFPVIKRGGGTVCFSIRRSQRGLQFPSASMHYLRCVTKLFVRKLLYSSVFFLAPSIIWMSFGTVYHSAHSILSQGIGLLIYKLLQHKKMLKTLQHYIVCTWERGRTAGRKSSKWVRAQDTQRELFKGEGKEGRVVWVFLPFLVYRDVYFGRYKHRECRNSSSRNKSLQGEGDGEQ